MVRPLVIGVMIACTKPATWVANLVNRLANDPVFRLIVVQQELHDQHTALRSDAKGFEQLAQWILSKYIDKPLFAQDPLAEKSLQAGINTAAAESLATCDVILNLTHSALPAHWFENGQAPAIWSAHEETLNERIQEALLAKAPLMWMHIWAAAGNGLPARRIASHSLPRQTYSISDLARTTRFCLPTLFESRLRWLAADIDLIKQESGIRKDIADSVAIERRAMESQADDLTRNEYKPQASTGLSKLVRVIQLWLQQSIDRVSNRLWYEQWQLAVFKHEDNDVPLIDKMMLTPIDQYTSLPTPDNTWWADPHLCDHEGSTYLFFEEMAVGGVHGHLSVAMLHEDGQLSKIHHVMDQQSHLSYPFVFTHLNEIYMLPETASQRNVTLYKAEQFPNHWQPVKQLLDDSDLADTTVHFHDNRWWMFTNAMSHRSVDERDELHIYHAEHLRGPWLAHSMNPVMTGVDRARMAGPIVIENDQLYRVSQYGAHRYGYGINLNRIDTLSTTAYEETPVRRVVPDPASPWLGCHSMVHLNGVTVLDRIRRRRRF